MLHEIWVLILPIAQNYIYSMGFINHYQFIYQCIIKIEKHKNCRILIKAFLSELQCTCLNSISWFSTGLYMLLQASTTKLFLVWIFHDASKGCLYFMVVSLVRFLWISFHCETTPFFFNSYM